MISNVLAAAFGERARPNRVRVVAALAYVLVVTALFAKSLLTLMAHAVANSLHSHIPLVPAIAVYLLYTQPQLRHVALRTSSVGAAAMLALGALASAAGISLADRMSVNDYLALMTAAYLAVVTAGAFLFLGSDWLRIAAFPMAFLLFMIPLPDAAVSWLEMGSVHASADASAALFRLTGTPLMREGTVFALPGIVLEVARECSGIRSSWVLLITSVAASHMLLRTAWRRVALVLFVVPLAIVRNAIRIVTIGLLAVHIGPHMADSVIHRQGGPLFFALSLVPLFALVWWLRRQESQRRVSS